MLKKIIIRLALLLCILVLSNFIYKKWFYEKDVQKHSEIINLVRNIPDSTDIIYVGESSNIIFRGDDTDKRPISGFIADYYPELNTSDITKPASHSGVYKVLLENIPESNQVKTIVVTLNLRSFNAQWIYSNLETSLQKSLVLIKPYPPLFNRFLLSFKAYDIKNEEERTAQFKSKWKKDKFHLPFDFNFKNVTEWDKWMANVGIKDENGKKDKAKTELACHYIKAYAFQIDTLHNPRIKDFDDIVKLAKERNWNLVFNLLAENTEKAKELLGNELFFMINENAKILENYFSAQGVVVVNNLNQIENEQFIDQNWTTEHYAEKGRKQIAGNVAKSLRKWHGEYFETPDFRQTYQTGFFNDCDNNVIWGQMKTITNENAHSGKNSSLTGNGNNYSISFEYPLKIIPDSLIKTLNVDLWLYQKSLNHNALLVVEAGRQNFQSYWKGINLKDKFREINTWVHDSIRIPIPDSIINADLVKVYVYNPSRDKIYIDDIRIQLEE